MKFCSKPLLAARIITSLLTLALVIFIFFNSAQTAENSSAASGRVMAFLNNICLSLKIDFAFTQETVRTLAHFAEFGLLGVLSILTCLSFFSVKAKTILVPMAFSFLVALIDECIQLFSEGRAFQVSDLVIDFTGSLLGLVGVFIIALLIHNRKYRFREGN